MICHGLFNRHPKVKFATLNSARRGFRTASPPAGDGKSPRRSARSDQSFREHVWVAPFNEDSIELFRAVHGADRGLVGSEWPHPRTRRAAAVGQYFVPLGEVDMPRALR